MTWLDWLALYADALCWAGLAAGCLLVYRSKTS